MLIFLARKLKFFLDEYILMPEIAANMAVNKGNARPRKGGRHLIDGVDPESDFIGPHIPISTSVVQPDLYDDEDKTLKEGSNLEGDYGSIALLTFLYILQGIPLGLAGSIPMLLQSRQVSYKEQALFSFVYWPFSVKLLWAPLVDSIYWLQFGRRKTWLVPTQYLIGVFMIVLSWHIKDILGDGDEDAQVSVMLLTVIFFMLNFLAATQDIAVDGWALTMLSRRNVGWASTCNSVGQTTGYFLGNVLFLALESPEFCNNYLRSVPQAQGLVTLSGFLTFWGVVFFITTTLVWVLKQEKLDLSADPDQGIVETYKILGKVVKRPAVMSYCLILLTCKIGFAAADSLTSLKLIEAGLPKERLALFAVPMVPLQILLALGISKYTTGPRPMDVFLRAMPFRLILGLVYCALVYWATVAQTAPGEFPWYWYVITLGSYALHQVFVYSMFVATMAFAAKVSDPAIGGTYMTLLNTLSNLGGNWPATVALWMVDFLTWKNCTADGVDSCNSKTLTAECHAADGKCNTTMDGYYIESVACVILGLIWLVWKKSTVKRLDSLDLSAWKCPS
ncbi:acetyl-coenzyme A transporter 1-like [Haliotis rufescens]|uniref:acetyl-coenzyme A transporter 1-like n=1 Tax=Haliotis rufescens TaxID=6454 RepID=UPI00201F57A6|nr:acetyl-coenzyme A transporter 1-like [Haliotis rufescens]XP_048250113.1 acetyl-coenzyme A transporter 1-like [Haliotis rufescens]XP_048250114.1 acetyl-coenzyme A transporter 1-like [Haliotis rufescens]